MVDRVFVHIGLPKTATSYLQTIIWANRERLRERGVVVPGSERRDHLWASRTVREAAHPRSARRSATAPPGRGIRAELASADGTGLVSHEFFAAASADQATAHGRGPRTGRGPPRGDRARAARAVHGQLAGEPEERLDHADARLRATRVETGRRTSGTGGPSTCDWCSSAGRGGSARARPCRRPRPGGSAGGRLAPVRRHRRLPDRRASTCPGRSPTRRWASPRPRPCAGSTAGSAASSSAFDKGVYIRTFLADERLVPRGGERFWPEPDQIEECRRRGEEAVDYLRRTPIDVVGDLEHLRVPEVLDERRSAPSVTDDEVAEVAVDLVATMLGDVRQLRQPAAPARLRGASGLRRRGCARAGRADLSADSASCGPVA